MVTYSLLIIWLGSREKLLLQLKSNIGRAEKEVGDNIVFNPLMM